MMNPMLAEIAPPSTSLSNPAYAYEQKYDGQRIVAIVGKDGVQLMSRDGKDKARQYSRVAAALKTLPAGTVLDGEVVPLRKDKSIGSFHELQPMILAHQTNFPVAFVAFDVMDSPTVGNLCREPLARRRAVLEQILRPFLSDPHTIRISDYAAGDGWALYHRAVTHRWEGLMVKRLSSSYTQTRTSDWLKMPFVQRQEFVVGGFSAPRHSRQHFGSLCLGVMDKGQLVYVGSVGTGFTMVTLKLVAEHLEPYIHDDCPFAYGLPTDLESPTWLRPALVADCKFKRWTDDGKVLNAVWIGFRTDKAAQDVAREGT
jgi:bifunctional non-homologous end joining protein LigD